MRGHGAGDIAIPHETMSIPAAVARAARLTVLDIGLRRGIREASLTAVRLGLVHDLVVDLGWLRLLLRPDADTSGTDSCLACGLGDQRTATHRQDLTEGRNV